jgi:hypothetical protein
MSTTIDAAFVTEYEAKVHEVFQRKGSHLLQAVRHKTNVVGSTASFNKVGTGTAVTKSRHGTITPMNQTHTAPTCTLADFYAGDWVDKLDEAKTNINERDVIASGGAMALGRKIDDQITTVLDTTTETVIGLTVSSKAAIHATFVQFTEALWDNDVPNDSMVYAAITPRAWSQLSLIDAFARAEFVGFDSLPYKAGPAAGVGKWKDWNGVKWTMHTGLPGKGTATAKCFAWHQSAIGYASGKFAGNIAGNASVSADITWHGDRAAHFVNHMMSGQSVLIDTTGVIEANLDDTAAIATS